MRILGNFSVSSGKSKNLQFDVLHLSIAKKIKYILAKKLHQSYLSWHWRVIQSLMKNWLFVWKITRGIRWILMQAVESLKICIFMVCSCQKYVMFEIKLYRGVLCHMVKHELRVTCYELRDTSWNFKSANWNSKVRVQIHEFRVQIHKLRVRIYELRVRIHKLQVRIYELRVQAHKIRDRIHELGVRIYELWVGILELRAPIHELQVQVHQLRVQIHKSLSQ